MKVLIIAHIGETLGHVVRGLAIADELQKRNLTVEFATSQKAKKLLENWDNDYTFYEIPWNFSHNSCDPNSPTLSFLSKIEETNIEIIRLLKRVKPDMIVGCPGIFTTQAARTLNIPHVSILHGPYLTPITKLENFDELSKKIINFAKKIFIGGCVDSIYNYLSTKLNLIELTYNKYLSSEIIFIPQSNLPLKKQSNLYEFNYINASFGDSFDDYKLQDNDICYITFGSGNKCDLVQLINITKRVFSKIIISYGEKKLHGIPTDVICYPFLSSRSIAKFASAVICHGGIGTVGTFGNYNIPMLIIPTELDQAIMGVYALRNHLGLVYGLDRWRNQQYLGRTLPSIKEKEFLKYLYKLRDGGVPKAKIVSDGAEKIAEKIYEMTKCNKIVCDTYPQTKKDYDLRMIA